ncbi:hypothetical protein D3C76_852870 [compost metagenome]
MSFVEYDHVEHAFFKEWLILLEPLVACDHEHRIGCHEGIDELFLLLIDSLQDFLLAASHADLLPELGEDDSIFVRKLAYLVRPLGTERGQHDKQYLLDQSLLLELHGGHDRHEGLAGSHQVSQDGEPFLLHSVSKEVGTEQLEVIGLIL